MLWKTIFGPRPKIYQVPQLILWSLFGNQDDGPYGLFESEITKERDLKVALKWWARNPFHNLWFYTLAPPLWWSIALIGKGKGGRNYWPEQRPGILLALNPLPYFAWQTKSWCGYIGWRPQVQRANNNKPIGAFGIAFRNN